MIEHIQPDHAFQLSRLGPLGVIVWNGQPPNDRVFEEHCVVASDWVRDGGPFRVFLNVAGSFVPTMAQRRIVASYGEAMGLDAIRRIAILTDSALARGALLVLTWLARSKSIETRGFRPSEARAALAWLEEVEPGLDLAGAIDSVRRAEERFLASRTAVG